MEIRDQAKQRLANLKQQQQPLTTMAANAKSSKDNCPTCGQPLSNEAAQIKTRQEYESAAEGNVQRGPR